MAHIQATRKGGSRDIWLDVANVQYRPASGSTPYATVTFNTKNRDGDIITDGNVYLLGDDGSVLARFDLREQRAYPPLNHPT